MKNILSFLKNLLLKFFKLQKEINDYPLEFEILGKKISFDEITKISNLENSLNPSDLFDIGFWLYGADVIIKIKEIKLPKIMIGKN